MAAKAAILDFISERFLQVTPMFRIDILKVSLSFSSGEGGKNRFSIWRPWRPSWISDRNDFSYFQSTSHPDASY